MFNYLSLNVFPAASTIESQSVSVSNAAADSAPSGWLVNIALHLSVHYLFTEDSTEYLT